MILFQRKIHLEHALVRTIWQHCLPVLSKRPFLLAHGANAYVIASQASGTKWVLRATGRRSAKTKESY